MTLSKASRTAMEGLRLEWCDRAPLTWVKTKENCINQKKRHKNATHNIRANEIWNRCFDFLVTSKIVWQMKVLISHVTIDGFECTDEAIIKLDFKSSLHQIGKLARKIICESMRENQQLQAGDLNKGIFSHVNFNLEVIKI